MRFSHEIAVHSPVETVWNLLWQADRVGACLPGCREVRTIQPMRLYEATVEERVGPFRAHFDWEITVQEQDPMRRVEVLARGKDSKLAATARVSLIALLESEPESTRIDLETDLQMTGKIVSLGQTVIRRKADQVVAEFAANLQALLGARETSVTDA
jgi:carbon monoxide dehydrogenase subunit G